MALSVKQIKNQEKVARIEYAGEQVEFGYRPGEFTGDLLLAISEMDETKASAALDAMEAMLLPVLSWWDVEDENGQRLPITQATFRAMPLAFLGALMRGIQADQRPPASAPSDAS